MRKAGSSPGAYGVTHNDAEVVAKIVAAQAHHKKIDGFAGTALAFVPNDKFESFKAAVESALGTGHCHPLKIMG